jgi:hypothetical protein
MNVKLGRALAVGDEFYHEYDFGSTTYLRLKVVSERSGPTPAGGSRKLAQTEPPVIPCDACGREATQTCAGCSWEAGGRLCDACIEAHEHGAEMALPVVNSPRVGVCGYTG